MTGHITLTRCWSCQFNDHFSPPQPHTWLDEDDAAHMKLPFPPHSKQAVEKYPCACECAGGPGAHIPLTAEITDALRKGGNQ